MQLKNYSLISPTQYYFQEEMKHRPITVVDGIPAVKLNRLCVRLNGC